VDNVEFLSRWRPSVTEGLIDMPPTPYVMLPHIMTPQLSRGKNVRRIESKNKDRPAGEEET